MFMDLEHMEFGLLLGPTEDGLKDMRDVIHEIDWIIPADDEVTRFERGFGLFLCLCNRAWEQLWGGCICHKRKLKEDIALVEPRLELGDIDITPVPRKDLRAYELRDSGIH